MGKTGRLPNPVCWQRIYCMRLRLALTAVAAMLTTVLFAPSSAQAAPDGIACSAVGSYSRVINNTGYTFWLVGTYGNYRYWHVERYVSSTPYHDRSYVVRCSGSVIDWSTDIVPSSGVPARCNPQSSLSYKYIGAHDSYPFGSVFLTRYNYWHVLGFSPTGGLAYHHSEVATC